MAAPRAGYVYGVLTALCFGLSPILIKEGYVNLDSPVIGLSSGIASATLLFVLYLLPLRGWGDLLTMNRRALLFLTLSGLFVILGTIAKWLALQQAPVVLVIPLIQTTPLFTILFSLLFFRGSERITARVWWGGLLIAAGGVLVVLSGVMT